jgi:peptide-methionine (S)-S-oxide reductase
MRRPSPFGRSVVLAMLILWLAVATPAQAATEEAVFAGGCFWCMEHDLEHLSGVVEAVSGFSGGPGAKPTYAQVSAGGTGHQESVKVRFDTNRLSYATLLRAYWRNVDALDGGGQFCDRGDSYRPVIFTAGAGQAAAARASQLAAARELKRTPAALKVQIRPAAPFWPAEAYHQNFAERNQLKYNYYRWACGRDRRLDQLWGNKARSSLPWEGS